MSTDASRIVQKLWSYSTVLREEGDPTSSPCEPKLRDVLQGWCSFDLQHRIPRTIKGWLCFWVIDQHSRVLKTALFICDLSKGMCDDEWILANKGFRFGGGKNFQVAPRVRLVLPGVVGSFPEVSSSLAATFGGVC